MYNYSLTHAHGSKADGWYPYSSLYNYSLTHAHGSKADGWYPYSSSGSEGTEALFHQYVLIAQRLWGFMIVTVTV
jgi:hypothetical protein